MIGYSLTALKDPPPAPGWSLLTLYREHAPRRLDLTAQAIGSALEFVRAAGAGGDRPRTDVGSFELALTDPHVSTHHARLVAAPSGLEIQDLQSKNGVWVDGARVDQALLQAGALLRIGRTLLLVVRDHDLPGAAEQRFDMVWGSALMPLHAAIDARCVAGQPWLLWGEGGSGKRSLARALSHGLAEPGFAEFDASRIPSQLREVELLGNQRVRGAVAGSAGGLLYISHPEQLAERLLPAMFERAAALHATLVFGLTSAKPAALVARAIDLGALEFRLPALRDRVVEIPALIQSVVPRGLINVSVEFVEACCLESWPGNVSQLVRATRDAVARAVAERAGTLGQRHLRVDGCAR